MRTLLLLPFLALPASADLITVSQAGPADFSEIQPAIDAASDGDVIDIAGGVYSNFVITNKALMLRGSNSTTIAGTQITGSCNLSDLAAGKVLVVRGLEVLGLFVDGSPLDHGHALRIEDCAGWVVVEDCELIGGDDDGSGIEAISCEHLVINDTSSTCSALETALVPGAGVRTADAGVVIVNGSTLRGQAIIGAGVSAPRAGPGLAADSSLCLTWRSTLRGGTGHFGSPSSCPWPGNGGSGLETISGVPILHDTTLIGGDGSGCTNCGICGNCNCASDGFAVSGPALWLTGETSVRTNVSLEVLASDAIRIESSRQAGDTVWAIVSTAPRAQFVREQNGVYLADFQTEFAGPEWHLLESDSAGSAVVEFVSLPPPPVANEMYSVYVQTVHIDGFGESHFGPLRTALVRESTGVSLCHGDGGTQVGCTDCPCNNNAPAETIGGCLNAQGESCRLHASGTPSVSRDSLRFDVRFATPDSAARLASADNALPNLGPCAPGSGLQSFALDGLRCIGGNLERHGVRAVGPDGSNINPWGPPSPNPPGGISAQGGFVAGQTRRFQSFYRGDPLLVCGTGQNTSNAIEITFLP